MRTIAPAAGILATALLLPRLAVAQGEAPPPQPAPTFAEEVEVTEVLLDAQVTDRDGNVIVGLSKDDFVVAEDGKPVALTDVKFYSSRARVDAAGRAMTAAEAQRLFILFFHDQRRINTEVPGLLARELDAGRRARDWVRKLAAEDYVAVASYESSLSVELDFSRDRKALQRAIDQALTGRGPDGNWPSRLPPEGELSLLRSLPRGDELSKATPTVYEGLQVLANAAHHLVGRKNLVLFSSGFGQANSFGQFVPDPRYDAPTAHALNDANVAVYAVDLVETGGDFPLSSALSLLANETGGRYFQNVVNFVTPLEGISAETTGYYLLAYRATHPRGQSGYQKVTVTLRNPEFRVKAREGYTFGE
jgi:VWFA-related protein